MKELEHIRSLAKECTRVYRSIPPYINIVKKASDVQTEHAVQLFIMVGHIDIQERSMPRQIGAGECVFSVQSVDQENNTVFNSESEDLLAIQIIALSSDVRDAIAYLHKENYELAEIEGITCEPISTKIFNALNRILEIRDMGETDFVSPLVRKEITFYMAQSHLNNMFGLRQSKDRKIERAIEWIRQNFRSECRIATAAKSVGVERTYLHRRFKETLGISPVDYRTELRMKEAQRLMLIDRLSPTQAATAVGYLSAPPFTRAYSRFFGQPPSRDIKQRRDDEATTETRGWP